MTQQFDYENEEYETLDSQTADINMDAAGLDGHVTHLGADRSLSRNLSDYDENSGPGGASGIGDDPYLGGSTGTADDVGMHIEPGFSIGYDNSEVSGIGPDTGNEVQGGGYTSLADAAAGITVGDPDGGTDLQTALGVPDVGDQSGDNNLSLEMVADNEAGYGAEGTDSDLDTEQ